MELRSLQLQVQEERLASAQQLQQQLNSSKGVQAPASDMSSLLGPLPASRPGGQSMSLVGGGGFAGLLAKVIVVFIAGVRGGGCRIVGEGVRM